MGVLDGRVAVVTGASRGIGTAIAKRFAAEGAAVAVVARTQAEGDHQLEGSLTSVVEELTATGARAVAIRADLSSPADRARIVPEAEDALGPLDILVNNAAVTFFQPVDGFPEKRSRLMFDVQVHAPFELAQAVVPGMRERGRGWILNISSRAAIHPQGPPYDARFARGTVYGMCKAALERFTTGLAAELYADSIAVNVLSPTQVVATPGVVFHKLIPEGVTGTDEPPEVMADAALALCSGDPKALTGRVAYSQDLLRELGRPIPGAAG